MAITAHPQPEVRESCDYVQLMAEIKRQYLGDKRPWIVCYSGGKDSTALLQLVFYSLAELPPDKLQKEVHVITNDTLVENPAVVEYVRGQMHLVEEAGKQQLFWHRPELFHVTTVTPTIEDSFWVNLIGKGYPSPNRWFRWCTERLKINPTSRYIKETVGSHGETIIVLGTRKAESSNRAAAMSSHYSGGRLRQHDIPKVYVYAPLADLSNNEVWAYLLQAPSPWGGDNRALLRLYSNACKGGECPFVIETGTQSCGKSRFGCWVCTVVDNDKAMEGYVDNGHAWMKDLLDFRNWLYDIRQQSYQQLPRCFDGRVRFGAFLIRTRRTMLSRLIEMQDRLGVQLISPEEYSRTCAWLDAESTTVTERIQTFSYETKTGAKLTVYADFNLRSTPRARLGPYFLKNSTCRRGHGGSALADAMLTRVAYVTNLPSHGPAAAGAPHRVRRDVGAGKDTDERHP
jgi:DNA sulfur modification protein DndC